MPEEKKVEKITVKDEHKIIPETNRQANKAPVTNKAQISEFLWETIKIVIISLAIILPIRYFIIQPFYVKGASMEPNFYDHEYLIVDEISYRFREPARGEVIVFRYPRDPREFFIKRIIGLPGETIKIHNGQITIFNKQHPKGFKLDESAYLPKNVYTQGNLEIKLKNDEYFVMGDNRGSSLDSRRFGPIKRQSIIGRTWIRGWPINKITVF